MHQKKKFDIIWPFCTMSLTTGMMLGFCAVSFSIFQRKWPWLANTNHHDAWRMQNRFENSAWCTVCALITVYIKTLFLDVQQMDKNEEWIFKINLCVPKINSTFMVFENLEGKCNFFLFGQTIPLSFYMHNECHKRIVFLIS